ncbi:hypothetical protein BASA62_004483 [Batrachochytrium salamandrivorans]|nr:hypothetical protein BASA62_004483 [Batrachochytrium salamandrivorans]
MQTQSGHTSAGLYGDRSERKFREYRTQSYDVRYQANLTRSIIYGLKPLGKSCGAAPDDAIHVKQPSTRYGEFEADAYDAVGE